MDKITVKVMSHSCKMADITDQEISCKHTFQFSLFIFSKFQVQAASFPLERRDEN